MEIGHPSNEPERSKPRFRSPAGKKRSNRLRPVASSSLSGIYFVVGAFGPGVFRAGAFGATGFAAGAFGADTFGIGAWGTRFSAGFGAGAGGTKFPAGFTACA